MSHHIATVHIRQQRGKLTVVAMGQTPKEQTYIRQSVPLLAHTFAAKDFKSEVAKAVEQLTQGNEPTP